MTFTIVIFYDALETHPEIAGVHLPISHVQRSMDQVAKSNLF